MHMALGHTVDAHRYALIVATYTRSQRDHRAMHNSLPSLIYYYYVLIARSFFYSFPLSTYSKICLMGSWTWAWARLEQAINLTTLYIQYVSTSKCAVLYVILKHMWGSLCACIPSRNARTHQHTGTREYTRLRVHVWTMFLLSFFNSFRPFITFTNNVQFYSMGVLLFLAVFNSFNFVHLLSLSELSSVRCYFSDSPNWLMASCTLELSYKKEEKKTGNQQKLNVFIN